MTAQAGPAARGRLDAEGLLRQSIYSRLAGYEDVNDAERLSQDPTFRLLGSGGFRFLLDVRALG